MYEINLSIRDINFNSILNVLTPVFQKYNVPVSLGKTALFLLPENKKLELIISLVQKNDKKILSALQDFINKNNIVLTLKELQINSAEEKTTELKLIADEVNFESIAKFLVPVMCSNLKDRKELVFLNELLNNTEVSTNAILAALKEIPEDMKSNLVLSAAKCYNSNIVQSLNVQLAHKGIEANIIQFSLEKI